MRRSVLAFGIATLALGATNVALMRTAVDTTPILDARPVRPDAAGAPLEQPSPTSTARDLTELLERPLFAPGRRPYAPPPPPEPVAAPPPVVVEVAPPPPVVAAPPPDLRLLGVSLSAGIPSALLSGGEGQAPAWVSQGGAIEGWTLVAVASGGASLENGGQRIDLALYPKAAPAAPAPE